MRILCILDSTGDRILIFDDVGATRACVEAKAVFDRMLARGCTAFKVNRADGKPDVKATDFSTLENETIVVPPIVGG